MNTRKWLSALFQFLVLAPAAFSCYLPAKNQMRYTPVRTAALCAALLVPFSVLGIWLYARLEFDLNWMILPTLTVFFFLYRRTVKIDFSRALAIFTGVCAIETFPAQFAFALDAALHPDAGAANLSPEAAAFQLTLSLLLLAAFALPALHQFAGMIDRIDLPRVWYSTAVFSVLFFALNILLIPRSYRTLQAGRLSYIFPVVEGGALFVLVTVYLLFFQNAKALLEQARLENRAQLLEMQAHQYRTLQEHIRQTSRQRHDFRHSVHLLTTLADRGDLESIRTHLAEYETRLAESTPVCYCANAALNALFTYYHEMAALAGVYMDWHIQMPEPLTFSELDMAGLFGNLMENAVYGCQTLPENQRYFSLTTEIRHGNSLYIVSTNSFDGQASKGKDGYHSTRHNGKGTGLLSIAAIAEKYQGQARFSHKNREFFVDVILKI